MLWWRLIGKFLPTTKVSIFSNLATDGTAAKYEPAEILFYKAMQSICNCNQAVTFNQNSLDFLLTVVPFKFEQG